VTPNIILQVKLATKARIGINLPDRSAADEAIEDLTAAFNRAPELVLPKSAYSRTFELQSEGEKIEKFPVIGNQKSAKDQELLDSLSDIDSWEFFDIYQAANELFARGFYRKCCELLCDRVSFPHENPALQPLWTCPGLVPVSFEQCLL